MKNWYGFTALAAMSAAFSSAACGVGKPSSPHDNSAGADAGSTASAGSTSGGHSSAGGAAGDGADGSDDETDPLAGLPTGSAQLRALCARNNGDQVSQAFCGSSTAPAVASLRDLQLLLGLDLTNPLSAQGAIITQSTSIARRLITPITPRAIVFTMKRPLATTLNPSGDAHPNPSWVTMAFARGEQFVEIAAKDPTANDAIRFYLFNFQQECNSAPGGCSHADLFTPDGEKHLTSYSLYEDVDLANTSLDCTQCHQIQGPGTRKALINQTYGYDWGHWAISADGLRESRILCDKFNEAHAADEDYFGIPHAYLGCTSVGDYGSASNEIAGPSVGGPQALDQLFYDNGFGFDLMDSSNAPDKVDKLVFREVKYESPQQPEVNVPIGVSPRWQSLFDRHVPGQTLELPYHDLLDTDPQKLSAAIESYKAVMAGTMPKSQLPDLGDLLLEVGLPDMSITPQPNLTGAQILTAMCMQCHNSHVDQSLSRAHFDVEKLGQLDRSEKNEAIRRLHLPQTSARHMPPHRFHDLSAQQVDLVTQELMR